MEDTYNIDAEKIRRFLEFNSLARKVFSVDPLPCGDIPVYEIEDIKLEEISILCMSEGKQKVHTAKEFMWDNKKDQFRGQEFQIYSKGDLDNIKRDILNKEETALLYLIKKATKKAGNYIFCEEKEDVIDKIKDLKYSSVWLSKDKFGDGVISLLHNKSETNSSNLNGFIFLEGEELMSNGVFVIRTDTSAVFDNKTGECTCFEDVGMFAIGKSIIYVEVGNEM